MARTTALARVRGQLLRMLDADDLLTPGALARDINILAARPDIGWTGCAALDLLPDGTLIKPFPDLLPAGAIAPGALLHSYRDPPSEHPVVVADTERPVVAVGRG
ncbi:MAG TPA: glycosyltransferase family A protein [Pseudonocardiaceae bacterium]|nr:glycosyltransferase family A protein [Pseudonocardiaceae bacterium]